LPTVTRSLATSQVKRTRVASDLKIVSPFKADAYMSDISILVDPAFVRFGAMRIEIDQVKVYEVLAGELTNVQSLKVQTGGRRLPRQCRITALPRRINGLRAGPPDTSPPRRPAPARGTSPPPRALTRRTRPIPRAPPPSAPPASYSAPRAARPSPTRTPQPGPDDCPADITANSPGCPAVWFDNVEMTDGMYIVVRHRNHLDIMSVRPATRQGDLYSYDFSTSVEQAFGGELGQHLDDSGVAVMFGGDANGNEMAEVRDALYTMLDNSIPVYSDRDCNMDGFLTRHECGYYLPGLISYHPHAGRVSQVP